MKNERKEELKDEMKNRISLALKDPILQQGFEIICKENAELKGEADSVLNNWCKGDDPCPHLKKRDEQLTKAKFLLKQLVDAFPKSYSDVVKDTLEEAIKFVEE